LDNSQDQGFGTSQLGVTPFERIVYTLAKTGIIFGTEGGKDDVVGSWPRLHKDTYLGLRDGKSLRSACLLNRRCCLACTGFALIFATIDTTHHLVMVST
jgi:hypothetical protein